MSRTEATERSLLWLEEQLTLLGGLRNATSRDSAFKTWRQNTLTVLQRIWPADSARSERFRRIVFSPPGSRPDPSQVRGMYGRGCQEASNYLRGLIAEVEADGVPEVGMVAERDLSVPHGEDDFPTVELPRADARAQRSPDAGDNDIVLDLGGPSIESPLAPEPRAEDAGTPPTLKVEVKATPPAPAAPVASSNPPVAATPAPVAAPEPERTAAPAERPRAGKSGKPAKRGTMKQRLKDMLGLSHLVAPTPEETTPSAPVEEARASAAPHAEPPASSLPAAEAAPIEGSGVFTTKPSKKQRAKRTVSIESLISPEFRNAAPQEATPEPVVASAPEPIAASPEPVAEPVAAPTAWTPVSPPSPSEPTHEESELDPEEFARATEDFLKNSPVLGLVGKPVQRQKDDCDFLEPDAVALASLAADVSRLGVPEGRRAAARALLLDLARHVEAGDADWATLRGTVNFAMEFPELAKRLMPVLLPWFERAA